MYSVIQKNTNKYIGLNNNPPSSWPGFYFIEKVPVGYEWKDGYMLNIYYDIEKEVFYAEYELITEEE